jgi:nitrogenase-stabilizing/protective protein
MSKTLDDFKQLVDAEEYFQFFDLPYDLDVVNVHRLHILRKFSNAIKAIDQAETAPRSEQETLNLYRSALQDAYTIFLSSNGIEQRLFKVFQQKPNNVVLLSEIDES